jgi:hypothetical protein
MYDFWETLVFHKVVYKVNPMKTSMIMHKLHKLKKKIFKSG